MPDERASIDQVSRYWDAFVLGESRAAIDFEPGLASTIRHIHELGATPATSARERVWQQVLANAKMPPAGKEDPRFHALTPSQLLFSTPVVDSSGNERLVVRRQRWPIAQFATAALLILTVVGSYFVFGAGQLGRQMETPISLPAISATPTTPEPIEAPVAEFLWRSDGSPDLPFREPNHPVVDAQGNIWVPDGWNSRFVIHAPDGTFLEAWGVEGSGDGEFLFESGGIGFGGVAFDAAGNIYVADSGNHRVQKFGPDRSFITAWGSNGMENGQLYQPVALVVEGQERVYVSDRSGTIEVFSTDGQWMASWEGMGSPVGIAVDGGGNIWVADEGKGEVVQFAPDGTRLATWDDRGSKDGQLNQPAGIDVDAAGRIFVSDRNNRVQIFTPEGEFLASWGSYGNDVGEINGPYGVTVDDSGTVYVAEDFALRLQAFRLLPPFAPGAAAAPMTPTPVADETSVAELIWETTGGPGLPLDVPYKVEIDPTGNLWVADGGNNRFQIFAPDGTFLESWGTAGSGEGQFNFTMGSSGYGAVIWDTAGNFYVTDSGNDRIQKFAPNRTFLAAWGTGGQGDGQFLELNDLAMDGEGRLYATDHVRHDVQIFDSDGRYLGAWGGYGEEKGKFTNPGSVAVDGDGNLYISEYHGHRVQKFSPDGTVLAVWGSSGTDEGQFLNPTDVSLDGQGRIFVTDAANRRVQVFDEDGRFLAAWDGIGLDESGFDSPTGIALDGKGYVYVSDEGSDRIQKFKLLPPLAPE